MTSALAGSPDQLLARPGAPPVALDGSGRPLGIERGIAYPARWVPCGPGTPLLRHGNALPEARLPDGTQLGEAAARAMPEAALREDSLAAVVDDLARIAAVAGTRLDDDLTLLCLGC